MANGNDGEKIVASFHKSSHLQNCKTSIKSRSLRFFLLFSELCRGKAMVASYTKLHQHKREKSKRLRGEGDQIKFIDLGFERWQVVRFRKARGRIDVP